MEELDQPSVDPAGVADERAEDRVQLTTQLSALLAELVRTEEVPLAPWSTDLAPGGKLGKFRIVRELGRGGFGVVYEAADEDLGRAVALKVLRPGTRVAAHAQEWLEREARAVACLNHPTIVTLHDFGRAESCPYLVFELLSGPSLSARLERGRLGVEEALEVGVEVARALVHAHAAGVVHRDLKPANVHLEDGGGVKVLDFGLAHLFGRGPGSGGTPAYMAPEQWTGEGDERSDVFALGVILHEALSARLPYRAGKGWSEAQEPGPAPALPRGAAPRQVRALVRRMISRDAAERPQTAAEVRDALLAARAALRGRTRRRVVTALGATALVATAAAIALAVRPGPGQGEAVKAVLGALSNETAEADLAAVPGLLRAALEPSPRVKVVPAARVAQLEREARLPARALDLERGREVAQLAGAAVLLLPAARPIDAGGVALSVRAYEAETGRVLFEHRVELPRGGGLAEAVDRLSDGVRERLAERDADRRIVRPVAVQVTSSAEAARHYYEGVECLERRRAGPSASDACLASFERALQADPAFGLAHYQLALIRSRQGESPAAARPHLEGALRAVDRVPPREAKLIRALDARHRGRLDEAARLYDDALAESPEDAATLLAAADVQIDRSDWRGARQYLAKARGLAPEQEEPLLQLVEALGRTGDLAALRALADELAAEPSSSLRSQGLVHAMLWRGEADAAIAEARAAVRERGDAELALLRLALLSAGEFREAEDAARRELRLRPGASTPTWALFRALLGQGRLEAAAASLEGAFEGELGAGELASLRFELNATLAAARGDVGAVQREARRAGEVAPAFAGPNALVLALFGDVASARALRPSLPEGSVTRAELDALLAWRDGDDRRAIASLVTLEARDPCPVLGLPPAFLTAEVAAATGDHREVLAAAERLRRMPARGPWSPWAHDRILLATARARAALGDREGARRDLDRLLAALAYADPGMPLAAEARRARERL